MHYVKTLTLIISTLKNNFFKIISRQLLEVFQTLPRRHLVVHLIYHKKRV